MLAALLRSQGIPTGFCYQRTTITDDDSKGYALHCFNAAYVDGRWIKVDAQGDYTDVSAQFSLGEPILAFLCRPEYDEYFFPGIYASPHEPTMLILEQANCREDIFCNFPDIITTKPDIGE